MAGVECDPIVGGIKRRKKRQPLDVVPMKMGKKERSLDGLVAKFALQALAQSALRSSAIQVDETVVG